MRDRSATKPEAIRRNGLAETQSLFDDQDAAARGAGATDVDAVVAVFFRGLSHAVAAVLAEFAARAALAVSARVHAVVTLFADADDRVAADGAALARGGAEAAQRELVRRAGGLSLGLEHSDLVDLAVLKAEVGGRAGAERHRARHGRVDAAEIDGEPLVDEQPDVVVTQEVQRVRGLRVVLEPVTHLAGEAEVVRRHPRLLREARAVGYVDARRVALRRRREGVAVDREEERRSIHDTGPEHGRVVSIFDRAGDHRVAKRRVPVAVGGLVPARAGDRRTCG